MNRTIRHLFNLSLIAVLAIYATATPAVAQTPATIADIQQCVSWGKIPQIEGAHNIRYDFSTMRLKAPGTFSDAAAFYRKSLSTVGWAEDATPVPGVDQKDYLYLGFEKNGMRMGINGYRSDPKGPMTITFSINGNVNAKLLPKMADAKIVTDQPTAVFYHSDSKPEAVAAFCKKEIAVKGWTEVEEETAKFHAKEGRTILKFVNNAMQIGVTISKLPEGKTQVTYYTSVRHAFDPADVKKQFTPAMIAVPPTPKEYIAVLDLKSFPQLEKAEKRDRQTGPLVTAVSSTYQAPGKLDDAISFFQKAFLEKGWKETDCDRDIPEQAKIQFEQKGYHVTVGLSQREKKGFTAVSIINHGNVDIRQLPFPPGVEISPKRIEFINAITSLNEADTFAFFRKELSALGWKELTDRKSLQAIEFMQKAAVIRIEIGQDDEKRTRIQFRTHLIAVE